MQNKFYLVSGLSQKGNFDWWRHFLVSLIFDGQKYRKNANNFWWFSTDKSHKKLSLLMTTDSDRPNIIYFYCSSIYLKLQACRNLTKKGTILKKWEGNHNLGLWTAHKLGMANKRWFKCYLNVCQKICLCQNKLQ